MQPQELKSVSEIYYKCLNGSWDLALSIQERPPYCANRLEAGALRRTYDIKLGTTSEKQPTFWGLGTTTSSGRFEYNGPLSLLEVSGDIITKTATPTYATRDTAYRRKFCVQSNNQTKSKGRDSQTVQIIYADDTLMVTREAPTMNVRSIVYV